MGHLGLTPQSTPSFGGYRVQGKTRESFEAIMEDALELYRMGVFAILLEAMPSAPAGLIAKKLPFPWALKATGKRLIHKTDVGGVRLGITNTHDAMRTLHELKKIR